MTRPDPTEHLPYYAKYVAMVPETDAIAVMSQGLDAMRDLFQQTDDAAMGVLHPPYTWTGKQVIGHLIDSERIFAYRALRFARGDEAPLPGFDENHYVRVANFDSRSLADLAAEYETARLASLSLFRSFDESAFARKGTANGAGVTVRALAFIIAGHERHHAGILKKRLGLAE